MIFVDEDPVICEWSANLDAKVFIRPDQMARVDLRALPDQLILSLLVPSGYAISGIKVLGKKW